MKIVNSMLGILQQPRGNNCLVNQLTALLVIGTCGQLSFIVWVMRTVFDQNQMLLTVKVSLALLCSSFIGGNIILLIWAFKRNVQKSGGDKSNENKIKIQIGTRAHSSITSENYYTFSISLSTDLLEKMILNYFWSNWESLPRCVGSYHTNDFIEMVEINAVNIARPWFPETVDSHWHYATFQDTNRAYYVNREHQFLIYYVNENFTLYFYDKLDGLEKLDESKQSKLRELMTQYWKGRFTLPNEALLYAEGIIKELYPRN